MLTIPLFMAFHAERDELKHLFQRFRLGKSCLQERLNGHISGWMKTASSVWSRTDCNGCLRSTVGDGYDDQLVMHHALPVQSYHDLLLEFGKGILA